MFSRIRSARTPLLAVSAVVLASSLASAQHVVNRDRGQGTTFVPAEKVNTPVKQSVFENVTDVVQVAADVANIVSHLVSTFEPPVGGLPGGGRPLPGGGGARTQLGVYDR